MIANIVTDCIVYLLNKKSFYASMALCTKFETSERIPTAGVYVNKGVNIIINPKFFATLTVEEQAGVLEHEFRHVLEKHIIRAKELIPELNSKDKNLIQTLKTNRNFKRLNVAQDLVINQNIASSRYGVALPKMACFTEKFFIPKGEISEQYFNRLKKGLYSCPECTLPCTKEAAKERNVRAKKENNKELVCNDKTFCSCPKDQLGEMLDNHELWAESTEGQAELEAEIKEFVSKSIAKNEQMRGEIPADISKKIEALLRNPYNWKAHLSKFISRSAETIKVETRAKRNRRYGFKYPGYRSEEVLNLGLAIDTSGSVDENMLTLIYAQLNTIRATTPFIITVIECDATVQAVYQLNKPKTIFDSKGGGGTCFLPAIEKAEELKLDALIYFTDGYGEHNLRKPKIPTIWAIVPSGTDDYVKGKGQVLKLPENKV